MPWTADEKAYIKANCAFMTDQEIADQLGKTKEAVGVLRRNICGKKARRWTKEEEDILRDCWGAMTINGICKKLGRSRNAIMVRVNRLGLPPFLESGEYITVNQLHKIIYGTAFSGYQEKSWIQDRGFPVRYKRRGKCSYKIVYLEDFWEWAEKNRSFLDFSKMEPLALGAEPDWVADQRKKDYRSFALQRKDPWTPDEDSRLKMLLKQHRYGYAEMSDILQRTAGAIMKRCTDLGLKERPVKADAHSKESAWTDADCQILAEGIRNGDSYTLIGKRLGKSDKAVRGKVYFVYLTENADKVREMMGSNPWGSGAPVPTVKQAIHLSRTRSETRGMLERLAGVLYHRTMELKKGDYDHFFQRAVCQHWDELKSICGAGCEDCDSCADFLRIQPQYCVRCGGTFFERHENKYCQPCRIARKKQAQRHWRRVNALK